jgi:hypothetical protein
MLHQGTPRWILGKRRRFPNNEKGVFGPSEGDIHPFSVSEKANSAPRSYAREYHDILFLSLKAVHSADFYKLQNARAKRTPQALLNFVLLLGIGCDEGHTAAKGHLREPSA